MVNNERKGLIVILFNVDTSLLMSEGPKKDFESNLKRCFIIMEIEKVFVQN